MTRLPSLPLIALGAALALAAGSLAACGQRSGDVKVLVAEADLTTLGSPSHERGLIRFTEFRGIDGPRVVLDEDREVSVRANLEGLPAGDYQLWTDPDGRCDAHGPGGLNAVHISELEVDDDGEASVETYLPGVSVSGGAVSLVGQAVIVRGVESGEVVACGLVMRS